MNAHCTPGMWPSAAVSRGTCRVAHLGAFGEDQERARTRMSVDGASLVNMAIKDEPSDVRARCSRVGLRRGSVVAELRLVHRVVTVLPVVP